MTNEQLVTLIKSGIDTADNMLQLWQQNRGFIGRIANTYKGYEDIEDLKQQGYIGLCNAVQGYRPEEDILFINYAAFWIRQSMIRYIENSGNIVRIPSHERRKQVNYKKVVREFEAAAGRKPDNYEICRCMGISPKELENLKEVDKMSRVRSLDDYLSDDEETTVGDMVPGCDDVERIVLDEIERNELKKILWSMVDSLPQKQPQVIRSLYQEGKTLKATGKIIGASPERVRTIKQNALRELRKPDRKRVLALCLPEAIESMAYHHNGTSEFERTWTSSTELAALKIYEEICTSLVTG